MLVHSMLSIFMNSDVNIHIMYKKSGAVMVIEKENYGNISHQNICFCFPVFTIVN